MATTTATITLSSTDLLSDELALTSTATLTKTTTATGIEDTTGLSRKKIKFTKNSLILILKTKVINERKSIRSWLR